MDTLGTQHFVLCREVVLFRRLFCIECYYIEYFWFVLCSEVCPLLECPLSEVSLYYVLLLLLQVLQYLKQTVDRYARTQEGFEKRLGRARKTMLYRAQMRNSQVKESVARQIVKRQLLQQNSRTDLSDSFVIVSTPEGSPALVKTNSRSQLPAPAASREESAKGGGQERRSGGGGGGSRIGEMKGQQRSIKKRNKKVSTDTLFAVMIFYEFLQELASVSEEQSVMHSLLYLPKSTSLLIQ